PDEAEVHRDDGLGRLQVRLLGATEPRDHRGDQRARPAVGDDDRPALEALERPAHPAISVVDTRFSSSLDIPRALWPGRAWHLAARAGCRGFYGPVPSASLDVERDAPALEPSIDTTSARERRAAGLRQLGCRREGREDGRRMARAAHTGAVRRP